MARGRKTGGKNFKAGQSGNPKGRPPLPVDLKEARELNREELERIINRFLYMTKDEVKAYSQAGTATTLELMVIGLIGKAITHGDHHRLGFIAERLIGKVKQPVEVSATSSLADLVRAAEGGPGDRET